MCVNYQLADLLVRIKVGGRTYDKIVKVSLTKSNLSIIAALYRQGAISSFFVANDREVLVTLKYTYGKPLIKDIKVISTPGRRIFWTLRELSLEYNRNANNSFYILSTPKGLLTSTECLIANHITGEVLLKIEFN